MKGILYGLAATCMVHAVATAETKTQTIVLSANSESPHIVFSTNITITGTSGGAGGGAGGMVNVNGKVVTFSTNFTTKVVTSSKKGINVSKGDDGTAQVSVKVFNADGDEVSSAMPGKEKKVTRMGVSTDEIDEVVREQLGLDSGAGLAVLAVTPDSPAAKAGVMKNDILIRLDDQLLVDPRQLGKLVMAKKPGDKVKLVYLRKGKEGKAEVTLDEHAEWGQGQVQLLDLGDMGGALNVNISELLKGIKVNDSNITSMIEEAMKAVEKSKKDQ